MIEEIVSVISDPRSSKNQWYSLSELILIIFSSVICGYNEPDEMADFAKEKINWLRKFAKFEKGTPSHETLRYFLCAINPVELIHGFGEFVKQNKLEFEGDTISIDGKTMRGTDRGGQDAIHLISAWSSEHGITLGALQSKGKKNEIKSIPDVIDQLDARGATITVDAMGCQKAISTKIIDSGNDYMLQLKGNQKCLLEQVKAFHHKLERENYSFNEFETIEKDHGRIETRRYSQFALNDWIEGRNDWSELNSAIRVERTRETRGFKAEEVSWYISSLPLGTSVKAANAIRHHWGIENKLHWRLDVIFNDDSCGMHSGNGSINLSLIKRHCMNLLGKDKAKKPLRRKLMKATISDDYREDMLFG